MSNEFVTAIQKATKYDALLRVIFTGVRLGGCEALGTLGKELFFSMPIELTDVVRYLEPELYEQTLAELQAEEAAKEAAKEAKTDDADGD